MSINHYRIAIDGPAGAGKSTVAKALANCLGIRYLDTGAMYRAIALCALESGIDPGNETAMEGLLPNAAISVGFTADGQRVYLGARDVTDSIRTTEVSMGASKAAIHPCVRRKLAAMQRQVAAEYPVVMDGRDITTNVLPDTPYKFYVTASPEERARRRFAELTEKGNTNGESYESVLLDIMKRDAQDTGRAFMPLTVAKDAMVVDTTAMSIQEVTEFMRQQIYRLDQEAGR